METRTLGEMEQEFLEAMQVMNKHKVVHLTGHCIS